MEAAEAVAGTKALEGTEALAGRGVREAPEPMEATAEGSFTLGRKLGWSRCRGSKRSTLVASAGQAVSTGAVARAALVVPTVHWPRPIRLVVMGIRARTAPMARAGNLERRAA